MSWMRPASLACLALLFVLTLFFEIDSASAANGISHKRSKGLPDWLRRIFMDERDATIFFKRRGRRALKSQDELNAEQRQRLAADERKREYNEEQRNEFENYAEEEDNEQDERTHESTEQWREFHHDGLDPSYEYNRHAV